jgi:predicted regulator of Ras-like GTPase activity (Roadblock/LC7/MglB family)
MEAGIANRIKILLSEILDAPGVQAVILLDSDGFTLESASKAEMDIAELTGLARDAIISNIRLSAGFRESVFIQGALETSKCLLLLTQFPRGVYLVTIAERGAGIQKLWNEVGKRYRSLAQAMQI